MRCMRLLHLSGVGFVYNTHHGYRIKYLRDFDKKTEPQLKTIPTKWGGRVQWWKEP